MATQTPIVTDDETMETLSAVTLPQLLACKHSETGHFLAVVTDGPLKDYLEFIADVDQFSLRAQFVVERADNEQDVHLKSCYNGKYWVRESDKFNSFITATADEAVDDTNAWNNTLFLPRGAGADGTKFTLFKPLMSPVGESIHHITGPDRQFLRLSGFVGPTVYISAVDSTTPVVTLPRLVSFKGDNGKFLQVSGEETGPSYNVFKGDNLADTRAMYEIVPVDNGFVKIKSYQFDKFLKRSTINDLIIGNSDDGGENETLFGVFKRPETASTIIIRNVSNNMLCTSSSSSNDRPDYLIANGTQGDAKEAHIQVVEPVISRDIYTQDAGFRLAEAVLYDHETFEMDRAAVGNTYDAPRQVHKMLTFTKSRTSCWYNNETIKWDGSAVLRGFIPQIIGDNKVVLRDNYEGPYSWGQPIEESETFTILHEILLPPMGAIYATLVAKKCTCKVQFSYSQRDLLTTGIYKSYKKYDGVYIGTHVYGYEIIEKTTPYTVVNDAE